MKELNELVELAKKATPGKWSCSPYNTDARFCAQVWDASDTALLSHDGKGESASNDVAFIAAANPETILAIAEAFRALEQRAEAAEANYLDAVEYTKQLKNNYRAIEAKLAEYEKQEVYAFGNRYTNMSEESPNFAGSIFNKPWGDYTKPLFIRPAPTILHNIEEVACTSQSR